MSTTSRFLIALSVLSLTACSSAEEKPQVQPEKPATTTTMTTTMTTTSAVASTSKATKPTIEVDEAKLQQIDVQSFVNGTVRSFSFANDGTKSACSVSDNVVTCWGNADDAASSLSDQEPNSIALATNGLAYTYADGKPTAQRELNTGQWVDFGNVQCAKPTDAALVCRSGSAAFAVDGATLAIHTRGDIHNSATDLAIESAHEGAEYDQGTDALVSAPMMCGASAGHRLAEVAQGEMSCEEAMGILDRYDAVKYSQGQGNTLAVEIDGWLCSSPTAVRSKELGASTVCQNQNRGLEVRNPAI